MIKHTETTPQLLPKNCLSVFDYFVRLALKGLRWLNVFIVLYKVNIFVALAKVKTVFTTDQSTRGGKVIKLKKTVDEALKQCPNVQTIFVSQRTDSDKSLVPGRDVKLEEVSNFVRISEHLGLSLMRKLFQLIEGKIYFAEVFFLVLFFE